MTNIDKNHSTKELVDILVFIAILQFDFLNQKFLNFNGDSRCRNRTDKIQMERVEEGSEVSSFILEQNYEILEQKCLNYSYMI